MIQSELGAAAVLRTVLRMLRDHGRPLYVDDLVDAFRGHDVEPAELRRTLKAALERGLIEQPAPGWWSAS